MTSAAVHEIDIMRWMFDSELVRVRAMRSRAFGADDSRDPTLLIFENEAGALIDVEVHANAHYGYDVRGELVGERGTVSLAPPIEVHMRQSGQQSFGFAPDWRGRFAAAYRNELQAWVNAIRQDGSTGPSAWDGYVATAAALAGAESLKTGKPVDIRLEQRPSLYA